MMVESGGKSGVADRVKISVGPLLERARILRRDAGRLVRQLAKNSEEIRALTNRPEEMPPGPDDADLPKDRPSEKPR